MTNPWRLSYDSRPQRLKSGTRIASARVILVDAGAFDELVLVGRNGRALIHIEMMDTHQVWMQVGDADINVFDGKVSGVAVHIMRGGHGPANGTTNAGFATFGHGALRTSRAKAKAKTSRAKKRRKGK